MKTIETNTSAQNNVNAISKKTLATIKKQATAFIGGFRAACLAILEVANSGDADAKKLCAYLGINAESVKNKNISETRKHILDRLPLYYTIDGSDSRFPARLKKVSADMIEAGVTKGYIAVKDTYLNALIALGGMLSHDDSYTQLQLTLTDTSASAIADMSADNTNCIVYDKSGAMINDCTEAYILFKNAKKIATVKAKNIASIAYAEALK